jgi:hypothetical protein
MDDRLPTPSPCPVCWSTLDAAKSVGTDPAARPGPGDLTICAYCRTVLVFGPGLQLREADDKERAEFHRRINALRGKR